MTPEARSLSDPGAKEPHPVTVFIHPPPFFEHRKHTARVFHKLPFLPSYRYCLNCASSRSRSKFEYIQVEMSYLGNITTKRSLLHRRLRNRWRHHFTLQYGAGHSQALSIAPSLILKVFRCLVITTEYQPHSDPVWSLQSAFAPCRQCLLRTGWLFSETYYERCSNS